MELAIGILLWSMYATLAAVNESAAQDCVWGFIAGLAAVIAAGWLYRRRKHG